MRMQNMHIVGASSCESAVCDGESAFHFASRCRRRLRSGLACSGAVGQEGRIWRLAMITREVRPAPRVRPPSFLLREAWRHYWVV
jgi:hypothetical protein